MPAPTRTREIITFTFMPDEVTPGFVAFVRRLEGYLQRMEGRIEALQDSLAALEVRVRALEPP